MFHLPLYFNFDMLEWKTLNKSLTFIHFFPVLSFHGWVIQIAQYFYTGEDG